MLYTIIRKDRLNRYRNKVCQLAFLKHKKEEILNRFGLQAYDYSKIKVTTGNGHKLTDAERAAINCERYDYKIRQIEASIQPETLELAEQIARVDSESNNWRHAEALKSYYLDGETKADTAYRIYGDDDKQDVKNLNDLLNTALEILEKVSSTPFVEVKRLVIEEWEDG